MDLRLTVKVAIVTGSSRGSRGPTSDPGQLNGRVAQVARGSEGNFARAPGVFWW